MTDEDLGTRGYNFGRALFGRPTNLRSSPVRGGWLVDFVCALIGRPAIERDAAPGVLDEGPDEREIANNGIDGITGLPNRLAFVNQLRSLPVPEDDGVAPGVCYIDLDGFKVVNDTLGHTAGDRLLRTIAKRLSDAMSPNGHMVARIDGDEFAILVTQSLDRESLEDIASVALETVRRSVRIGEHDVAISASVGVVRQGSGGPDEMMKAADTTLRIAKEEGRGRYAVFDQERHRSDVLMFELSAQLPEALRKDHLHALYQPVVRLSDERIVEVESQVYWFRPDGEVFAPERFLDLAENTGLIVPLGRRLLDLACAEASAWREKDPANPIVVSLPCSARQTAESSFTTDIDNALRRYGLPRGLIQLQIKQQQLLGGNNKPSDLWYELSELGVAIAIEGFGAELLSVNEIARYPLHGARLSGGLISGVGEREDATLESVVELARSSGLEVTGVGVETREEVERLARFGVVKAQGLYYAPGLLPETISEIVQNPFVR